MTSKILQVWDSLRTQDTGHMKNKPKTLIQLTEFERKFAETAYYKKLRFWEVSFKIQDSEIWVKLRETLKTPGTIHHDPYNFATSLFGGYLCLYNPQFHYPCHQDKTYNIYNISNNILFSADQVNIILVICIYIPFTKLNNLSKHSLNLITNINFIG